MSTLDIFRYASGDVRVAVDENGDPWFSVLDVAAILDLGNPRSSVALLDEDERGVHTMDTPGGQQVLNTVSESGLYSLVLRSRKPEAKAFKRWVTREVLPSIRRTGSYSVAPALPQSYADALRELASTVEQNAALEAKVELDAPKVGYVDTYVASEDLRLVRNVAKSIGVTESALRDALIDHGWVYAEHTDRWSESKQAKETITRYSAFAAKKDYFRPVPAHDAPRFKGEVMHTLKVTPKGAAAIARVASSWGLMPIELAVA